MKTWSIILDYGGKQLAREIVRANTRKKAEEIAWKLHPAALEIVEAERLFLRKNYENS